MYRILGSSENLFLCCRGFSYWINVRALRSLFGEDYGLFLNG